MNSWVRLGVANASPCLDDAKALVVMVVPPIALQAVAVVDAVWWRV